jgi:hypothetical protein
LGFIKNIKCLLIGVPRTPISKINLIFKNYEVTEGIYVVIVTKHIKQSIASFLMSGEESNYLLIYRNMHEILEILGLLSNVAED